MPKTEAVTFLNSRGEVISNDPVWKAQQLLGIKPDDSDDEMPEENPYANMSARELKELAAERGVDISGLKRVGEVRDALAAADEEAKSDAEE